MADILSGPDGTTTTHSPRTTTHRPPNHRRITPISSPMGGGEGGEFDRLRAPHVNRISREKEDEMGSRRRAAVMYLIASALFLVAGIAGLVGGIKTSLAFIVLSVAFAMLALNAWTSPKDSADS